MAQPQHTTDERRSRGDARPAETSRPDEMRPDSLAPDRRRAYLSALASAGAAERSIAMLGLSHGIGNARLARVLDDHAGARRSRSSGPVIARWAAPDQQVMAEIHGMDLLDALREYVRESLEPAPGWASRREAIKQAIRDRLNRLAHQRNSDELAEYVRRVAAAPDLTDADDWPRRVVSHYAGLAQRPTGARDDDVADPPPDPALMAAAGAAVSSGTFSMAVYTAVEGAEAEFRRAAVSFAADHRSLGVRHGRLVHGREAAVPAASTADVVDVVTETVTRVRALLGRPETTIDTLALFAHGVNASRRPGGRSYVNLMGGHQIVNPQQAGHGGAGDQMPATAFVERVSSALGDRARVVLYACELGDSFYGGENAGRYAGWNAGQQAEARQGALEDELSRGDTSLGDELRDLLNATGGHREVWGHRTTGHTTSNPTWRRFGSETAAGADGLFGEDAADPGMTADEGWQLNRRNIGLARRIVNEIAEQLRQSPGLSPATVRQLEARGRGLVGWVARELPLAPAPFVEGIPPVVRAEVVRYLEARAAEHEPAAERASGRRGR